MQIPQKIEVKNRGHPELNQGPLDLQSNALPLSYIPVVISVPCYVYKSISYCQDGQGLTQDNGIDSRTWKLFFYSAKIMIEMDEEDDQTTLKLQFLYLLLQTSTFYNNLEFFKLVWPLWISCDVIKSYSIIKKYSLKTTCLSITSAYFLVRSFKTHCYTPLITSSHKNVIECVIFHRQILYLGYSQRNQFLCGLILLGQVWPSHKKYKFYCQWFATKRLFLTIKTKSVFETEHLNFGLFRDCAAR